ncbi:MAG: hypothetical protein QOE32_4257, partial [Pseudonocardiales bacterium]|nr:hypothetical protein [Pseudonocardiales bacterium]
MCGGADVRAALMCGACGSDRGAADWARPFLAGLPARSAVANAVARLLGPAGPRVQARGGGWLVRSPTGAMTDCAGLGELVVAVSRWLGTPVSAFGAGAGAPGGAAGAGPGAGAGALGAAIAGAEPSGRLLVPPPDARRGVRLRVDPAVAPQPLSDRSDTVVVPCAEDALRVLAELSLPPWSLRRYLASVTGTPESWAAAPVSVRAPAPEYAADL